MSGITVDYCIIKLRQGRFIGNLLATEDGVEDAGTRLECRYETGDVIAVTHRFDTAEEVMAEIQTMLNIYGWQIRQQKESSPPS